MNISGIWQNISEMWKPEVKELREDPITPVALERIRRSPGHQNLSELNDEPEWYHE